MLPLYCLDALQTKRHTSIVLSSYIQGVHMQLPHLLARKILDLQFLPHLMITNPHVRQVYNHYFQAFETLRDTPEITTMTQNRAFTAILENLLATRCLPAARCALPNPQMTALTKLFPVLMYP